nr:atp-dependent rna helicase dbp5 [Quercus suber]
MADSKQSAPSVGTNGSTAKFSWADDATTPIKESSSAQPGDDEKQDTSNDLSKAQTDGATQLLGGSDGLDEPAFDVKVTLSDLQEDPQNPLYSVKTFDELNL